MGMIMRHGFFLAVLVVAAVSVSPAAFAWEVQHTGTNPDGSPQFADPDATTDAMAAHLADGNSGSGMGNALHFGDSSISISGGSGYSSGSSPAMQNYFVGNPAVSRTVPNSNW